MDILYKKAAYEKDRLACFGGWDKEEEKDVPFTVAVKGEDGKILHAVIRLECWERILSLCFGAVSDAASPSAAVKDSDRKAEKEMRF